MSGSVWESSRVTQTTSSSESLAGRNPTLWAEKWHELYFLSTDQNINAVNERARPTRLGGQFGEEQLTTIRSPCMFSRHQLPTSDSVNKNHHLTQCEINKLLRPHSDDTVRTWAIKARQRKQAVWTWAWVTSMQRDSLEVSEVTLPLVISTINSSYSREQNNFHHFGQKIAYRMEISKTKQPWGFRSCFPGSDCTLRLRWGHAMMILWLSADQHWGDNWEL